MIQSQKIVYFFFLFVWHTHSIWKFPGQGWHPSCSCDLHHSFSNTSPFNPLRWARESNPPVCSDPSCCKDNTGSLTHCPTAGTPKYFFFFCLFSFSGAAPVAYGGSKARGLIRAVFPAYAGATATRDPSRICDLPHSSQQHKILNPLSEVRDRTHNFMVPCWIC